MRIAVIFNPGSGPRAASRALSAVVAALASHNHVLDVIDSDRQPDFERYLGERTSNFDRAIAVGGDGTLNGVINAIASSDHPGLPVAFVPTGRGKDTSRSIPSWAPGAMGEATFELADVTPIDLIRMTLASGIVRYGINVADIGLAAQAAVTANGLPRQLGSLAYVLGAARGIVPPKPFLLRFSVDGASVSIADALLLSVCNGRSFGGGIHIAPMADCTDGWLDIVVAHNANLLDLATQLPKLRKGTLINHPALMHWRAKSVTIEHAANPWYEVDGEQLSSQPVSFDIAPHALNWVTP